MKTTYLLGAGASANAVPVVGQIPSRIAALKKLATVGLTTPYTITIPLLGGKLDATPEQKEILSNNITSLNKVLDYLLSIADRHPSIDTYARKLHLQDRNNNDELEHFKSALTLFISLSEALKVPDKRYDLWMASVLQNSDMSGLSFPASMNILSWNYDCQIERVYSEYLEASLSDQELLQKSANQLGIIEKYSLGTRLNKEHSNIVKLNGSAKFTTTSNPRFKRSNPLIKCSRGISADFFIEAMNLYNDACDPQIRDVYSTLSFAWENDGDLDFQYELDSLLGQTSRLVIIGYSFPDFNRNIDVILASRMSNLQSIWIVEPDDKYERIKSRVTSTFDEANNRIGGRVSFGRSEIDQFPISPELRFS